MSDGRIRRVAVMSKATKSLKLSDPRELKCYIETHFASRTIERFIVESIA